MYYDANGADYISTPSFAIPDTGILTVEVWMKSKLNITIRQSIITDNASSPTVGYFDMYRATNTDNLRYEYTDGITYRAVTLTNLFQNLDNQ
jgi:hypothetical protein